MRIKRITLIGFKSFMDKTDIDFHEGISAIVGPNGCGKSNLVDAIRWVMGAQSAKQLRGRSMEDVIFNGAGNYKPMGMAEVTIIIEDTKGNLPSWLGGATQVAITRRLYRSGESEYLINNVPCRLKDIHDIFMDTGLGTRAYSIINQGQISFIMEQRPEDIRVLLEEAAGITRYRKRVEESKRKISATKQNLQRVEDILNEIQTQMRSLKRQASKARKYKRLQEEIKGLELNLSSRIYNDLIMESRERERKKILLEQEITAKEGTLSGIELNISRGKIELDEKEKLINEKRREFMELRDKLNRKQMEKESIRQEIVLQSSLIERLNKEIKDLKRSIGDYSEEKGRLNQALNDKREALISIEGNVKILDERFKNKSELLNDARRQFEEVKEAISSGKAKEAGLDKESSFLIKRIQEITDTTGRLELEREETKKRIHEIAKMIDRQSQIRDALRVKISGIQEEINHLEAELEALKDRRRELKENLRLAEADKKVLDSRFMSLKNIIENFEGYKVGVRAILRARNQDLKDQASIKGTVADIIQVEPGYENAVEGAMGDRLQHVIVESIEDIKKAIDYLKRSSKGRSGFIPLSSLNGVPVDSKLSNGMPHLVEKITVKDEFRSLINNLLKDIIVAEDLNQALEEWEKNGKEKTFVTKEGDLIEKDGVIIGGKNLFESSGILTRRRELREIKHRIKEAQSKIDELLLEIENVEKEIENSNQKLELLLTQKEDSQDKLKDVESNLFQLSSQMDHAEHIIKRIEDEISNTTKEKQRRKEELLKVESELLKHRDSIKDKEFYFKEKELELNEIEREYEELREELSKLRMNENLIKSEISSLSREIQRMDSLIANSRKSILQKEEEIASVKERIEQYGEKSLEIDDEIESYTEIIKEKEQSLKMLEQEKYNQMTYIKEEEEKATELRRELDSLKDELGRIKLSSSEISVRVQDLKASVQEKFNINLEDAYKEYLKEEIPTEELKAQIEEKRMFKDKIGEVNLLAIEEHEALKERYEFMNNQREDLIKSIESLERAIRKINRVSKERFIETFNKVNAEFSRVFPMLFDGGSAHLKLTDENHPLESGVLIQVHPPGKRLSHIGLLSGGEKALGALAFLFSIYLIKPSPFCFLDEVDSPLDDINLDRFTRLLREITKYSQVIMITHNRRSMEIADRLYGVTMGKDGISTIVTVRLDKDLENNQN